MGPLYFIRDLTRALRKLHVLHEVSNINFSNHPTYWKDLNPENPEYEKRDATSPVRTATVEINITLSVPPERIIKDVMDSVNTSMEVLNLEIMETPSQHILIDGKVLKADSVYDAQLKIVLKNLD